MFFILSICFSVLIFHFVPLFLYHLRPVITSSIRERWQNVCNLDFLCGFCTFHHQRTAKCEYITESFKNCSPVFCPYVHYQHVENSDSNTNNASSPISAISSVPSHSAFFVCMAKQSAQEGTFISPLFL